MDVFMTVSSKGSLNPLYSISVGAGDAGQTLGEEGSASGQSGRARFRFSDAVVVCQYALAAQPPVRDARIKSIEID
jgi:hypothetical protein